MYTTEEKYLPFEIKVSNKPIIVVGMNPGRTRISKHSPYVWDGDTPTSNLLRKIVKPYTNIVLTNVCNYQDMSTKNVDEGMNDLAKMFKDIKPRKVICLGAYAHLAVRVLDPKCEIRKFLHPSYVVRFKKDKEEYTSKIRKELE